MADENNNAITISILNNELLLDDKCWCCDGGHKKPDPAWTNADGTCEHCDGTGFSPTSVGDAILAFMKRHGGKHEN